MFKALILVWRASPKALLAIGILLAWITRQPDPAPLQRWLWLGMLAGLAYLGRAPGHAPAAKAS